MQLCGMDEIPPVHTMPIPLEQIVVPNEPQVKPSARFMRNVDVLGIRQPPSVAFLQGSAWDAPDARYIVMMGRRRVVTARHLAAKKHDSRFSPLKCEVYEWHVPRLAALLGLVENDQRSESWVQDILRLRQLIREGVAMTLDDLAEYGFHRRTIKSRLDIALLPPGILDRICAGGVQQAVALQILRLKEAERVRLETLIQGGEALTASLVKSLLRRQVNQGMAVVNSGLAQYWTERSVEVTLPPPATLSTRNSPDLSLLEVQASLRRFDAQVVADPAFARARMLIQVLLKELDIVVRTPALQGQEGMVPHV